MGPNVDLGLNLGQSGSNLSEDPLMDRAPGICSHCLANTHVRARYKSHIKCHACWQWGHVAANCLGFYPGSNSSVPPKRVNGKGILELP